MRPRTRFRRLAFLLTLALPCLRVEAATYLPMSDADLTVGAPVIVRAFVVARTVRREEVGGEDRPFTIVTFQRVEALKGEVGETFTVRLPGGALARRVWWIPGTPTFSPGQEVVLMLGPAPGHPGEYRLTELGLSRFDLVTDEAGRLFAVRPAFGRAEDLAVSKRQAASSDAAVARDADSFLSFLRAIGRGKEAPEIDFGQPKGSLGQAAGRHGPAWVNLGGREPGDACGEPCLFRWFWDTGRSSAGVVRVSGTQTNLTNDDADGCGMDSVCDVQHAVDEWHGVAQSDVRYSGPSATGNILVNLDATRSQDGSAWTTPLDCSGGVIGLGGPGSANGPFTFKGDSPYYAPINATVSMRKVTCSLGYSARTFKTAVLHELGHTLGLGHPDDDGSGNAVESMHSTTSPNDWASAVMRSRISPAKPEAPLADDIQAIQYYYGTAAVDPAPVASFAISPAAPTAGTPVSFTDSSTGSPISWTWDFGDPGSGSFNASFSQNASHTFAAAGTYSVTLSAANANGTGSATRSVTVAGGASACTPGPSTLCLNGNRFAVSTAWRTSDGRSGQGTGVQLTSDAGYFWFFGSSNIEVVTKVLNGCAGNTHYYWVFSAGLTNTGVALTVTDTQNGTVRQFSNPLGTPYQPVQSTTAFATCP